VVLSLRLFFLDLSLWTLPLAYPMSSFPSSAPSNSPTVSTFAIASSYLTGTFGLLCLLSLLSARPQAYYLYRSAFIRTPEQLARLDAGWHVPYARFVQRLATLVWGLAFLGEALLDTLLVYHLPTAQWGVIHPFLLWGTMLVAFGWAILYSR
jgi:hypothetical protein